MYGTCNKFKYHVMESTLYSHHRIKFIAKSQTQFKNSSSFNKGNHNNDSVYTAGLY